jgi:protease-4
LLHFNTYGGEVNGIQALYNTIYNSPKKIVAFIDDDCHSAGYWLASATSHIIINTGASSFVGSIGVYRVHVSYEEFNKIEGVKYTYITSDKSIYKTIGNPNKDLTDADIEFLKKEPNNICTAFIGDVQKGRGKAAMQKSIDLGIDIFTGESFNGINAIEYGLADEIAKDGINSAFQKCQSYHTATIFKNKISFKF